MEYLCKRLFFSLLLVSGCCGIINGKVYKTITYNEKAKDADSLTIHEGILSTSAQRIIYKRYDKVCGIIELSEPVLVARADQKENWGFFQFPKIGKASDGTLVVSWHMREDSHKAYGTSGRKYIPMMSKDGGLTWIPQDKSYFVNSLGYNVCLNDGSSLHAFTPKAKDVNSFESFPKAIGKKGNISFFPTDSLPDELQGIYLNYVKEDQKSKVIHAKLEDPGSLRYAIDNLMPIIWWGNIKQLADQSLVAGVYPSYYRDSLGQVLPGGVSFYRSNDTGYSWSIIGKIPFCSDGIADKLGENCFTEPAFEVLPDSVFICVMRSGSTSPMYYTFSDDRGRTWTKPIPFAPNGVNPQIKLLKSGVLVLVSGRPGVQLRFSFDGTGLNWSDPIDMVHFVNENGTYIRDVSCGYASLIEDGDDSFFLVYSDFTTRDDKGQIRKSIFCRKVKVNHSN